MLTIPLAACPNCRWRLQAVETEPEEIVRVAMEFELHLAQEHDVTWHRARETARGWLELAIEASRVPSESHAKR